MASPGAGDIVVIGDQWTYVGQVCRGIFWGNTKTPQGRGVRTYTSGLKKGEVYEGQWRDGKQHGHGIYTWADKRRYEGQWLDGKRHGRGIIWYQDGQVFDGLWAVDRPLWGTMLETNGTLSHATYDGKSDVRAGWLWVGWIPAVRRPGGGFLDGRPRRFGSGRWTGTV